MSDSNKPTSSPEEQSSSSEQHNSDQTDDEISEPCLDNTDNTVSNELPLTEGHIESLNVTVVDREVGPIWRYNAQLDVLLEDGAQLPLNIWSVHDVPLSWQVGASYTLKNVKHKIRETATGQESVLRSTSSFTATRISKDTSRGSSKLSATNENKNQEVGSDESTGTNDIRSNSQSDNVGNNQTDVISLPDDRINKLTVRVLAREEEPGWKNDAELTVLLSDGRSLPLHIWSVHDTSFSWQVGATYVLTQVRHKIQEGPNSERCLLHSTKQLQVERISPKHLSEPLKGSSRSQSDSSESDDTYQSHRQRIINEIQDFADATESPLVLHDFIDNTAISFDQIREEFGSWKHLLYVAGIDNSSRIINEIQRVCEKLGHQPTAAEMDEHGRASAATFTRYFGTYSAALIQAFDEGGVSAPTTNTDRPAKDEESTDEARERYSASDPDTKTQDFPRLDEEAKSNLLDEISHFAGILQEPPSKELLIKYGKCDPQVYTKTFDTWESAIEASGHNPDFLPSGDRRMYSNVDILDRIQEAATTVGHAPDVIDAERELEFSAALASLRFGSWDTAVDIAVINNSLFSSSSNRNSLEPSKEKDPDTGSNYPNRDTQNNANIQNVIEDTLKDIMEADDITET